VSTTTTPDRADVTQWLLDLLIADEPTFPVGDHNAPDPLEYPYRVVWSVPGGSVSGPPLGESAADADLVYQVDSVGLTREQAERLAARTRRTVAGRLPDGSFHAAAEPPSGLSVSDRILDGSAGSPIVEGTRPNEVWTVSERFVISVTGA
jgi:hypothetical protein